MKTTRFLIIAIIAILGSSIAAMAAGQLVRDDENEAFRAPANLTLINRMLSPDGENRIILDDPSLEGYVVIDEFSYEVEEDSVLNFHILHVYQGNNLLFTLPLQDPVVYAEDQEIYFHVDGNDSVYDYIKLSPGALFIHRTGLPFDELIVDDEGDYVLTGICIILLDETPFYNYLI